MSDHTAQIFATLGSGPVPAESLRSALGVSRPTLARALATMRGEIVTLGAARSTRYALRDNVRGFPEITVYRVNSSGQIKPLGVLLPVWPDGFVMLQTDGLKLHFDGLPWWLADMRPQGFLGRAYAHQHAAGLGLPPDVRHWSDTDALRALLANGGDTVGNLLLGDLARDRFIGSPAPSAVDSVDYPRLSSEALTVGETWSSAGGEQPKFCTFTPLGHVLVKFTGAVDNNITQRWRDLLLAEHLALETLQKSALVARSRIVDVGSQRFLELERFDRVGAHGRRALLSLASLDGEFVGNATAPWPVLTSELARQKVITPEAHTRAALLYAFGSLIGNTDMHSGNLSFVGDHGQPYALSPAYDMLPMAFAPTSGGSVRDTLLAAYLHPAVGGDIWGKARELAMEYLTRLSQDTRFGDSFQPCISAIRGHVDETSKKIRKLE